MPVISAIVAACDRVAPLWPLTHFVAVNPFVGMTELAFEDAVALIERTAHAHVLPGQPGTTRARSVADLIGELTPRAINGHAFVVDEISKWCASYFDQGQAVWPMPWRDQSLWSAWKSAASVDANAELMGIAGFRARVRRLSDDPVEVIAAALTDLGVPVEAYGTYLLRLLMSTPGWSGFVQYRVRARQMAGAMSDELTQLMAIRITYDVALHDATPSIHPAWEDAHAQIASFHAGPAGESTEIADRHRRLADAEHAYQEVVATAIAGSRIPAEHTRPALQAVFCIDVRSEIFRRALEAQSLNIQTIGFAGFFGLSLAYRGDEGEPTESRCPVLLSPSLDAEDQSPAPRLARWFDDAWQSFKTSAPSCFSFVEAAGLGFGAVLATATTPRRAANRAALPMSAPLTLNLPIDDRVALAATLLRNMGLTRSFAKVVLLCGHGSASANNPYASSLDCGACGGHAGDANARVAATLLNDPWVRFGLTTQNIVIPADTTFVAALHNTTTDDVEVGDVDATIARWLTAASRVARRERSAALGLSELRGDALDVAVRRRSTDWSCVRPEWGLAGNAAFIAAPRARTRAVSLGGRAFLHEYDAAADATGSVLEMIMTAPMVVASWINLQYYASTIDNARFGSGNKVLHNVVGRFGVWQGNGGDLQVGLPWQSVHDGRALRHQPLRLSVFLEAPIARIDDVLRRNAHVHQLVANEWVRLLAIDPDSGDIRRLSEGQWVSLDDNADIATRPGLSAEAWPTPCAATADSFAPSAPRAASCVRGGAPARPHPHREAASRALR